MASSHPCQVQANGVKAKTEPTLYPTKKLDSRPTEFKQTQGPQQTQGAQQNQGDQQNQDDAGDGQAGNKCKKLNNEKRAKKTVIVENALLDAYCYSGIRKLYGCGVLFGLIFLATFMHTRGGAASFKSTVTKAFTSYDTGLKSEQSSAEGIRSMSDALQFMVGFMTSAVQNSRRDMPMGSCLVYLGDFVHITYAQLKIRFVAPCHSEETTVFTPATVRSSSIWEDVRRVYQGADTLRQGSAWRNYTIGGSAIDPPSLDDITTRALNVSNSRSLADKLVNLPLGECIRLQPQQLNLTSFPGWGVDGATQNLRNLLLLDSVPDNGTSVDNSIKISAVTMFELDELSFLDLVGRLHRVGSSPKIEGSSIRPVDLTDGKPCRKGYKRICTVVPPDDDQDPLIPDDDNNGTTTPKVCFCAHNVTGLPYALRAHMESDDSHATTAFVELVRLWPDCVAGTRMRDIEEGLAYLLVATRGMVSQYAMRLELGLQAVDRRNRDSTALMYMQVNRMLSGGQLEMQTLTITPFNARHPGIAFMVATILATVLDIWYTAFCMHASYLQRKTVMWLYLTGGAKRPRFTWHMLDVCHHFAMFAWICWWLNMHDQDRRQGAQSGVMPQSAQELADARVFATSFTRWLYMGTTLFLVAGLRALKHIKYHSGLRIFYTMFRLAYQDLLEFLVFVSGVVCLLCSTIFAIFIISGGNSTFSTFSTGLNAMSLLAFGFLGFDDFVQSGNGLGDRAWIVDVLFWLAVFLLLVVVQNTLLAIFSRAYEESKLDNARPRTTFLLYTLYDIAFWYYRIRWGIRVFWWAVVTDPQRITVNGSVKKLTGSADGSRQEGTDGRHQEGADGSCHAGRSRPWAYWTHAYWKQYVMAHWEECESKPNPPPSRPLSFWLVRLLARWIGCSNASVNSGNNASRQDTDEPAMNPQTSNRHQQVNGDNAEPTGDGQGRTAAQNWDGQEKKPSTWLQWLGKYFKYFFVRIREYALEAHCMEYEELISDVRKVQSSQCDSGQLVVGKSVRSEDTNSFRYHMLRWRLCSSLHMRALVSYYTDFDMSRLNVLQITPFFGGSSKPRTVIWVQDGAAKAEEDCQEGNEDDPEVAARAAFCMWHRLLEFNPTVKPTEPSGVTTQCPPVEIALSLRSETQTGAGHGSVAQGFWRNSSSFTDNQGGAQMPTSPPAHLTSGEPSRAPTEHPPVDATASAPGTVGSSTSLHPVDATMNLNAPEIKPQEKPQEKPQGKPPEEGPIKVYTLRRTRGNATSSSGGGGGGEPGAGPQNTAGGSTTWQEQVRGVMLQFYTKAYEAQAYEAEVMRLLVSGPLALGHAVEREKRKELDELGKHIRNLFTKQQETNSGGNGMTSQEPKHKDVECGCWSQTKPLSNNAEGNLNARKVWSAITWIPRIIWLALKYVVVYTRYNPFWPYLRYKEVEDEDLKKLVRALVAVYGPMPLSLTVGQQKKLNKRGHARGTNEAAGDGQQTGQGNAKSDREPIGWIITGSARVVLGL